MLLRKSSLIGAPAPVELPGFISDSWSTCGSTNILSTRKAVSIKGTGQAGATESRISRGVATRVAGIMLRRSKNMQAWVAKNRQMPLRLPKSTFGLAILQIELPAHQKKMNGRAHRVLIHFELKSINLKKTTQSKNETKLFYNLRGIFVSIYSDH